jgi:uncharacterized protein
MKELLEMIAKALVNHPDEVGVRSVAGQQVIGRQARTAEALRTIFGAAGMKLPKCVRVEIIE